MICLLYLAAIAVLVAADYFIKLAVVNNMSIGESISVIKGALNWTYITNSGASWGILHGKTIFLVVVTVALIAAIIWLIVTKRVESVLCNIAFVLVGAGGIGNLIDRVFNGGKVIDYIDISPIFNFPIFNFADCCVCVGGVLFCIYVIFFYEEKNKEEAAQETEEDNETV